MIRGRNKLTRADFAELEARVLALEEAGALKRMHRAWRGRLVENVVQGYITPGMAVALAQVAGTLKECPAPQRFGQDEYKCSGCGVIWGIDEERPPCQSTHPNSKPEGRK